jgi:hypothetical protein
MRGIIQRQDTSSGERTASRVRLAGIGLAVTSGLALGGQFPVAKTALPSVDAFHLKVAAITSRARP